MRRHEIGFAAKPRRLISTTPAADQTKGEKMEQRRKHFFQDGTEFGVTIITGICPNGEYGATREDEDEGHVRGYGHTRLAAIADLAEAISNTEEEERGTYATFQLDHARDYRKHEAV